MNRKIEILCFSPFSETRFDAELCWRWPGAEHLGAEHHVPEHPQHGRQPPGRQGVPHCDQGG